MERGDRRLGLWKQRWEETEEKKVTNFPESKDQNFHVSHFLSDGHTSSCSFGKKPELVFLCFCNQSLPRFARISEISQQLPIRFSHDSYWHINVSNTETYR